VNEARMKERSSAIRSGHRAEPGIGYEKGAATAKKAYKEGAR